MMRPNRAVRNMVTFLHEELEMSKADATLLLSATGDLKSLSSCGPAEDCSNGIRDELCGEIGVYYE